MEYDMRELDRARRYKILGSCVTPRPIAWVTSLSKHDLVNAAPYSFFNILGDDPPILALGLMRHGDNRLKDTAANIRDRGEFVVNLVSEDQGEAMNLTCIDAPPSVSEVELAELAMLPSRRIAPPRIASAPASFECRSRQVIETGLHQIVVIAEIIHAHIQDQFVKDGDRLYIDSLGMNLLGRMHGSGWYSRQTDLIRMARPRWDEVRMKHAGSLVNDDEGPKW